MSSILQDRIDEYPRRPEINEPADPAEGEPVTARLVAVVEDDADSSQATASLLQVAGYAVVCFPDGESFVDAWERLLPDAVVLDLTMPGMGGIEVLRHLRKERASSLPVVVVSGQLEGRTLFDVRRLGVTATLRKPVEADELEGVLRSAVGMMPPPGATTSTVDGPVPRAASERKRT